MKINEVIVEALNTDTGTTNADPATKKPSLWDKVKSIVPGTVNNRASSQGEKLSKQSRQQAQPWVNRWTQGVAANPAMNTPENLQKFAQRLATENGRPLFTVDTPNDMSATGISDYLTKVVARVVAGVETGNDNAPVITKQPQQVVPATAQPQPQQAGGWVTTPDGIQIKPASGRNPTFARYNKQLYRLTNDDRWVDVRDKPVSQTMTAALNNALEQT